MNRPHPMREQPAKSPSLLIRDMTLTRLSSLVKGDSLINKKHSSALAQIVAQAGRISLHRVCRWLENPDLYPLAWTELCDIAQTLGGSLKCVYSEIA